MIDVWNLSVVLVGLSLVAWQAAALPNLPLSTSGRWIVDTNGKTVTYAGANWPGHMAAMIPEGLQYQSIQHIVTRIKAIGMNSVRLTYATEMIDRVIESGSDVTIRDSLIKALGEKNGTEVLRQVLRNNSPVITEKTTRLQVFDAVAAECERQGIIVHLDNHISRAEWCCGSNDGNSWFGDTYYDTVKWKRAWKYMANHVCRRHTHTHIFVKNLNRKRIIQN
jgi:hypothetical protein